MPLALDEIYTFFNEISKDNLKVILEDLVKKKYLRYEHPKEMVEEKSPNGSIQKSRKHDINKEKGYNIVAGKLSYPISKILSPSKPTPTLVATDVDKLTVIDNGKLRRLTVREGLRLFGFPENYKLDLDYYKSFDLLGNTVVVEIVGMVAERTLI